MDKRNNLLQLLNKFKGVDEQEEKSRLEIIDFVKSNPECFDNDFKLGHITGSALVVDKGFIYMLLTYHPVIDKWLQFGGHSDSDPDVLTTAFREAEEESGLKSLQLVPGHEGIFDVDVHPIPPKVDMPFHNHYDIRVFLTADMDELYVASHESKELKWVELNEAEKYNQQPAFLRLVKKARDLGKNLTS